MCSRHARQSCSRWNLLAVNTEFDQLENEEARTSFTTYLLFLFHFVKILSKQGERQSAILKQLFQEQRSLLSNIRTVALGASELRRVRKMLFNAWNSEMVARLSSNLDQGLLTVTNQWKPIQAYYALYFLIAPLRMITAKDGFDGVDTHEKNLTFATNNLCSKLPRPWSCRYHVEGHRWLDFPSPPVMRAKSGWNLDRNNNSYDHFAQFLRTTGDHKRHEKWLKIKSRKPKSGEQRSKKKGHFVRVYFLLGRSLAV